MKASIVSVGAAALALLILVWVFQRKLIYFPSGAVPRPAGTVLRGAVDVTLRTQDGLTLGAWFVPAGGPASWGTVLVFNGNGGNRFLRAPLAAALSQKGLAVLLFDYRGYGGNPGQPTEAGLAADALAAVGFLKAQPGADPARIAYLGESLGAAVAVGAALARPPAALILRSPFTSLAATGAVHYPFLPVKLLLRDQYPSLERIGQIRCPLLVVAAEKDAIVPPAQSRALFDAAPHPQKRYVLFPAAGHNDDEFLDGPRFVDEIVQFLLHSLVTASPVSEFPQPALPRVSRGFPQP